jgi:hypothetical protein
MTLGGRNPLTHLIELLVGVEGVHVTGEQVVSLVCGADPVRVRVEVPDRFCEVDDAAEDI